MAVSVLLLGICCCIFISVFMCCFLSLLADKAIGEFEKRHTSPHNKIQICCSSVIIVSFMSILSCLLCFVKTEVYY